MKRRIFYGMFFSTSISLILASIMLCVIFYQQFSSATTKNLRNRAETFIDNSSQTAVEALAITKSSDMRVTVIMPDGTVVFDNTVQADKMPNHLNRSEIRDATKFGYGQSVRFSDTLQKETVYYAIKLTDDYVLRVAKTSSSILGMFMGVFPAVMLAVLIMGIICYLAAGSFTRRIIEPLCSIDLDGELAAPYDELAPFIKTIAQQRERIEGQLYEKAEAEKLRREFSANVSHELKTPLTSIYAGAEMLYNGMVKENDRLTFYGQIKNEAGRLITLIEDILMISKLDESSGQESFEDITTKAIATEVVEALSQKAAQSNVTVKVSGENVRLKANRSLIYEMLYNLIDNAIKYNKPGGTVDVDITTSENQPRITVTDTGIGIPKEAQSRVFERFYRVDKSRSKKTGGTGLGLAIVKHIALVHNGEIELKSKPGEGTTITVSFNPDE